MILCYAFEDPRFKDQKNFQIDVEGTVALDDVE